MVTAPVTRPAPDDVDVPPPAPPSIPAGVERPRRRWLRRLPRYTWSVTTSLLLFGCSSLTPSLLPRGWLLQGLIAGITAAIGYGVGVTIAWFVLSVSQRRPSATLRRRAWRVLAVLGPVVGLVMLWLGQRWQREIHLLMGLEPPPGFQSPGIVVVAVLVFAVFVGIGR